MAEFPANTIMTLVGDAPRHDLGGSYGPNLSLAQLLGADAPMADVKLGYGSAEGDAGLREAVAKVHGVTANDVVITVGGAHALFLLAFILCDRGDAAVITKPVFPPARAALDAVGARVRVLPLSFTDGYQVDSGALAKLLSGETRLVSVASPQNPSGVAIPRETLRSILDVMNASCRNAYLVVDETYREAAFGDDAIAPSAIGLSEKVVCVGSLSKCHGAPGLRVGWAVTRDPVLRAELVRGKFNTVISCSVVDEALALEVVAQRDQILAERRVFLSE
jgi:aspartate/methionine/tyrosine aminotransferase